MSSDNEDAFDKTNIFSSATQKVDVDDDIQVPPCLVLISGPSDQMGRQWVIDKSSLTIGRIPQSDIHVSEVSLSKAHARVDLTKNKVTITDLGSTNKTMIDGKILEPNQPHQLKNNDQIRAGSLVFKYLEQGILSETTEKARMQSELEKARTVQETLFPSKPEASYHWVRVGGQFRSATEIGGDWWWYWSCGEKVFAFLGDATGHGAAAGLITSAARSAIATIEDDTLATLERIYPIMSKAIQKCSGGQLSMSAFIVEVNLRSRLLRYVNASHLPAVYMPKNDPELSWRTLTHLDQPVSSPLGSTEQKLAIGELAVESGTRLVLLTDGLTERKGSQGDMMNERTFNSMLIQAHMLNLQSQSEFLTDLLSLSDQASASSVLDDDITVVALDFN